MVLEFVSRFWKWSQNAFKKNNFCQFFGPTHLLMLLCEVVGAQRAPNEGPKGPPMPSAGARRRGPQGPELLVILYYISPLCVPYSSICREHTMVQKKRPSLFSRLSRNIGLEKFSFSLKNYILSNILDILRKNREMLSLIERSLDLSYFSNYSVNKLSKKFRKFF